MQLVRGKLRWLAVLIPLLLFSLSALPVSGKDGVRNSIGKLMPPDAAPLEEQVLMYLLKEPRTLDVSLDNYGSGGSDWLFERLVMFNEDEELEPGAAERWTVSPDGRSWTFTLRKGARWSDGHPVTAGDFEYTFKRFLDPAEGNVFAFLFYDIKNARAFNHGEIKDRDQVGVRALDDLTLVIKTERPCAYLPFIVAYNSAAPVPPWQVEKYGRRWTEPGNCVSNYSYQLAEWVHDRYIVYTLNPYYNGPHKGYLEKIIIKFFSKTSSSPGLFAYENNEVDRQPVDVTDLARIERDPVLSRELHKNPHFRTWYLFFKTQKPPFDNLKVRQAISHAIDREIICRVVLRGLGTPAYTMLPPNFPGYVGDKYGSIQRYDPELGRQRLAEAGYPGGRGFPTVELWLRDAIPNIKAVAQAIQGMLKENLGIDIIIRNQEVGVYMDNMYQYAIPMGLIPYQYDYPDPHNLLSQVWHSQPVGHGRHDWTNLRFDELVDRAGEEMDPVRRFALYDQAEKTLVEDVGGVFIFHDYLVELRKPWMRGPTPNRNGRDIFWGNHTNIMDIYIANNVEKRIKLR